MNPLKSAGIPIAEAARAIGTSRTALSLGINRDIWPATGDLRGRFTQFLAARGLSAPATKKPRRAATRRGSVVNPVEEETQQMVTHRVTLTQLARAHFRIAQDPFADPADPADVYLSPDVRLVRETMWSTAKHGGFVAIVGESGSGKTTIREEFLERLQREQQPVIVIQPYVLAMEDSESKGKALRSQHIAEAAVRCVAPTARPCSSPEARFHQLHEVLKASARTGMRHLLIVEEAHALPTPTLNHLKRWLELKDGMRRLVSIMLIAQPELLLKLRGSNSAVREVTQRIEICQLAPLANVTEFLKHRFTRVGASIDAIVDPRAIDACSAVLGDVYPLAVQNVIARAINTAASLGAPRVTAEMVREGGR